MLISHKQSFRMLSVTCRCILYEWVWWCLWVVALGRWVAMRLREKSEYTNYKNWVDAYHMYAKTAYHMHANKFHIICTRKLRIICTPNTRVSYIRQNPFFSYQYHEFSFLFWRAIYTHFIRIYATVCQSVMIRQTCNYTDTVFSKSVATDNGLVYSLVELI